MSRENVEIARQGYEALNRDGVDGALRFLDREIDDRSQALAAVGLSE
jgi:hypothetical protein